MGEKLVNITYESLFEILQLEKKRPEIQELPKTFFEDVNYYLKEKKKILVMGQDNLFSDDEILKTQKQIENIIRIVNDLIKRRNIKILNLAVSMPDSGIEGFKLLENEIKLYNNVSEILKIHRKNIFSKFESAPKQENLKILVEFKSKIPKFVGKDMEVFGPYEEGQQAQLPAKIATILITKGRAIKI
jgi:DNA replication initiation complex subunit (GINS family)